MVRFITLLGSLCVALAVSAQDETDPGGWFWYEDPAIPEDPPEPEVILEPPAVSILESAAETDLPIVEPELVGPTPFSAEWVRDNFDAILMRAMNDPSPENVRAFAYVNRLMMDRSSQFAHALRDVVQSDPFLDESNRIPVSSAARTLWLRARSDAREAVLEHTADEAGLFFFFDSTCQFCTRQIEWIRPLSESYGIEIIPVSVDGRPLPGLSEPALPDRGLAERWEIEVVPALVLAYPPDTVATISQGLHTTSEIEERIILAADRLDRIPSDLRDQALPNRAGLIPQIADAADELDLEDPETLVRLLRGSLVDDAQEQSP